MISFEFEGGKTDVASAHIYFRPLVAANESEKRPYVVSEFGGYSYRVDGHSFNMENNFGYRKYMDRESFQRGFVELYEKEVVPLVERGLLCACIYTQVSDVEDETNGILTYDRRVCKLEKEEVEEVMSKLRT